MSCELISNKIPLIKYDSKDLLSDSTDIIKEIHKKYNLSESPAIIQVISSGKKMCIGYNYGANSEYGAYLFLVFLERLYLLDVICLNGI